MWSGYLPETFNETLGALHHARFLGSCLYIMKLVMLSFNVTPPGLLTPNMLAKIYDHEYRTRVPSTQSWLLRHHDWTSMYTVWEQMCTYQDIDASIVHVVRQSLLQPLWYLLIPVCGYWFEGCYGYTVHKFICILQYLMLSRFHERSMGKLPRSMLSIWFSFG